MNMRGSMRSIASLAVVLVLSLSLAGWAQKRVANGVGNVVFSDRMLVYGQDGQYVTKTAFTAGQFDGLFLRAYLPAALNKLAWDYMEVTVKLSHMGEKAVSRWTPDEVASKGASARDSLGLWIVEPGKDIGWLEYSDEFLSRKHLVDIPREQGIKQVTGDVKVVLFKQVGTKQITRYDKTARAVVTTTVPEYGTGRIVSQGTFTINVP